MSDVLLTGLEQVLTQGMAMLSSLTDEGYSAKLPEPYGASVGGHYRHILDHILCLYNGLRDGEVNYDHRSRDLRVESDRKCAMALTSTLIQLFSQLDPAIYRRQVRVAYTVRYGGSGVEWLESTVAREVAFCTEHAIHHYALIKLLCAQHETAVPQNFGIAPSTLRYRMSAAG